MGKENIRNGRMSKRKMRLEKMRRNVRKRSIWRGKTGENNYPVDADAIAE